MPVKANPLLDHRVEIDSSLDRCAGALKASLSPGILAGRPSDCPCEELPTRPRPHPVRTRWPCPGRKERYIHPAMEPFSSPRPLIGMVHLPPLPGSPRYRGEKMASIIDSALRDLSSLEEGGADGALVENLGDAPFAKLAPKETVAAMAVIVREVTRRARIPIGVNVLRNDGEAAIAIATVAGGSFVRVNVFSGVAFTDQGTIEGEARALLELRRRLGTFVSILADVHVKHAAHLNTIEEAATDATRDGPDGLIVTGTATGKEASPETLLAVKRSSALPVFVGSGVSLGNLQAYSQADGFIVGSSLKRDGQLDAPVDAALVRRLAEAVAGLGSLD